MQIRFFSQGSDQENLNQKTKVRHYPELLLVHAVTGIEVPDLGMLGVAEADQGQDQAQDCCCSHLVRETLKQI